ncbi:MAG: glutaredoxin family protein [Actinomycetota bacterium]
MTRVTLLTRPACDLCEQAKQVLARVSTDHLLRVEEVALDSPEGQALALRHAVLFAPGVLLDGEAFSYGRLSEKRLRRALQSR